MIEKRQNLKLHAAILLAALHGVKFSFRGCQLNLKLLVATDEVPVKQELAVQVTS